VQPWPCSGAGSGSVTSAVLEPVLVLVLDWYNSLVEYTTGTGTFNYIQKYIVPVRTCADTAECRSTTTSGGTNTCTSSTVVQLYC
jgi:hypothetical protein